MILEILDILANMVILDILANMVILENLVSLVILVVLVILLDLHPPHFKLYQYTTTSKSIVTI